jgi:hypothetical protein
MVKMEPVALKVCLGIPAGTDPLAPRATKVVLVSQALLDHKVTEERLARTAVMACKAREACQE